MIQYPWERHGGGTFIYDGAAQQYVMQGSYNNLTISNGYGNIAMGAITVDGELLLTGNSVLDANGKNITLNGTVSGMNTTNYLNSYSWATNLTIGASGDLGTLYVGGGYFGSITLNTSGGLLNIVPAGTVFVSIYNSINIASGATLDVGMLPVLDGSGIGMTTSIGGTFKTECIAGSGYDPVPMGKTWGGTFIYDGAAQQYVMEGTYSNLTINNGYGNIATGAITVDGELLLTGNSVLDANGNNITLNGTVSGMNASNYLNSNSWGTALKIGASGDLGTLYVGGGYFGSITMSASGCSMTIAPAGIVLVSIHNSINIASGATLDMGILPVLDGSGIGMTTSISGTFKTEYIAGSGYDPVPFGKTWGGTFIYDGASSQTIMFGTYNDLIINNGNTNDLANGMPGVSSYALTVNGNLNLTGSSLLDLNYDTLILNGTVTGMDAADYLTGDIGANIMIGATGSLGTLFFDQTTPGTTNQLATFTINGAGGSVTIGNTLSIDTALALNAGTLSDGGNIITNKGNITGTGTHTGTGKILMVSAAKTISGANLANLELNNAGGFSLTGSPTINGTLTLTSGTLTLGTDNLNFGPIASAASSSFSASNMIIADGTGVVNKQFAGAGSFLYPIGDNGGNYSPVTLTFGAGTFASATAGVNVAHAKLPQNANLTNYLNRYWKVTTAGTLPAYSIAANYVPGDVTGSEAGIATGQYTGSLPFTKYGLTNTSTHTLTASGISTSLSEFTGINNATPTVFITPIGASVCPGFSTLLTANGTGDPTLSYVWSPASGLSATNTATVNASPATTTSYTVVVTDGNGFTGSNTLVVSVNQVPTSSGATNSGTICNGGTVTLQDNSTNATAWAWSGSDGTVSTMQSPLMTPTATTTYSLTVSNSDGCANNTVYTTSVTVNALPTAGTIAGASSVSAGSNILLTDATGGGIWSASNGNASVLGGSVTGIAAGTVTISYAVTNGCGTAYATYLITVNGSSISGVNALCSGTTTTLTSASPGGTWSMESLIARINSAGLLTASADYTGTATVTYTLGGVHTTQVVTVYPNPTPIQITALECVGTTTTLSDATAGGVWSNSGDAIVSGVGTAGIFLAGAVAGSATITYTLPTGCYTTISRTVYANPFPITGVFNTCVGGVTNLSDPSIGTNWFSSDTAIAKVTGGAVRGIGTGTATITFESSTAGYCIATQTVTVGTQPAGISGNLGAICPGSALALADGAGTWTSSNPAVASVGSTGVVTGMAGGTAIVTFLVAGTGGCTAKTVVSVNTVAAITGTTTVCLGGMTSLADATGGGTWLSGSPGIATVNAAGVVTGVTTGTATITYTTAGGCAKTAIVTVSGVSAAINGNLFLCNGTTSTLSDATVGGTWSMSSAIATVAGATGVVAASASLTGTATISYTASGCSVIAVLTVNAKPTAILGAAAACAGLTTALSDATAGGTWSVSGDATISGIGASASLVAGAVAGTAIVSYTLGTGCKITSINTIYAKPLPIMGNFNLCVGLVTLLSDASPVSSWSSSNPTIAIASGGAITGAGPGMATITFKTSAAGNCLTTQVVTVSAMPVVTAINGPSTISHAGSPVSISDATAGGVWTSSNTSVIALSGSTGSPVGASALTSTGSSIITYAVTMAGCTTKVTKAIGAAASSHPDGGTVATISAGSTVSLADVAASGTWSSSDEGIATVDAAGIVTGIMPGSVNITHEMTRDDGTVCRNVTSVTVEALPMVINLLPNPNKGAFSVRGMLGNSADAEVILEVTNLLGQVIYRNKIIAVAGKLDETIMLSKTLANGMYILNVQSGTEKKTFHFVIEQ